MSEKKFKVRRNYDETAEMYDRRYESIQYKKFEDLKQNISLEKEKLILDVGAGTGLFAKFFGKQNQIICCDISIKMLKEGIKKNKLLFTVVCDSDSLPIKEESISLLTCFSVIQNVPNPSKTLEQINKTLCEEGKAIISALSKLYTRKNLRELVKNSFKLVKDWEMPIEDVALIIEKRKEN